MIGNPDRRRMTIHGYLSGYCKSRYSAVLAVLACLGLAVAQSIAPDEWQARTLPYVPPSPVQLRTEVDLVEVPVVVRDGRRHAVSGLTRDDFEIYDNGKKQTITAFSVERFASQVDAAGGTQPAGVPAAPVAEEGGSRPRYVALCFDDLNMSQPDLKPVAKSAVQFVKTALAPGDRVAVVTVAQPRGDYEFTGDVPKLVEQIAKVTSHRRFTDDPALQCPRISPYAAYVIEYGLDKDLLPAKVRECSLCRHSPCSEKEVISQARAISNEVFANSRNTLRVLESLVGGMARFPGQRMILLASAGFLTSDLEIDVDDLTAKALHAEVVINALDAKGLYTITPGGDASERGWGLAELTNEERAPEAQNDAMVELASGTGGAFYHNNNDLARGFRELGLVPEIMYVLGFSPSGDAAGGHFHSLKVRLKTGDRYSVQARLGYTKTPLNAAAPGAQLSKLDRVVIASDTVTDLPAWFTWEHRAGAPGVTLVAHLDVHRLRFETSQDRRKQKLNLVAVLLDSGGSFVTGKRSEVELSLKDVTFARLAKTGLTAEMTLRAPPGTYSARAVAQDALEGKLAAASETVEVKYKLQVR
jgi:VWFA-related protein